MPNEVTIPILPCRQLDDSIPFYEALGFKGTYCQNRPNPYAVVVREDIQIHLFAMDDFDPEQSYGSVIVAVPDPDELYEDFAAGPRAVYGKLPSAGIPRILRPRKSRARYEASAWSTLTAVGCGSPGLDTPKTKRRTRKPPALRE
jgi:hypothetical protein